MDSHYGQLPNFLTYLGGFESEVQQPVFSMSKGGVLRRVEEQLAVDSQGRSYAQAGARAVVDLIGDDIELLLVVAVEVREAQMAAVIAHGLVAARIRLVALTSVAMFGSATIDSRGLLYAVASGALTSGLGYAIWYSALRGLKATSAATVQLSVPIVTAVGGIVFLGEPVTARLVIASVAILGGVLLVISIGRTSSPSEQELSK